MKESDLKIITNNNNIFHIQVYIPIGSIHEKKGEYGISHFLEHLKFNRSQKYDTKTFRKKLGDFSYNAYTTLDHTSYHITADNKYQKELIDLIKEVVFNTKFSQNEIETERKIVLAEKLHTKQEKFILNDISIYHKKNPYYRAVIGNTNDINKLKNSNFKKYNEQYFNKFLVFISCPEKDKSKIKKLCLKKFPNPINKSIKPLQNIELFDYELSVRNLLDDKQIFIISFKTFDANDKNVNYIDIFDNIICKNKLSKLKYLLREKYGMVYAIESNINNFKDNGFYTIKLILKKDENIKKVMKLIFNEFNKLKNTELSKKEFENYKNKYLNNLDLKFKEDNKFYLNFIGRRLFYDNDFNIESYLDKIKNLTSTKLQDIFNKILNYHQMNIVLYGNYKNLNKKNEEIFKIIEKFRK